jgi:hypothetical protein
MIGRARGTLDLTFIFLWASFGLSSEAPLGMKLIKYSRLVFESNYVFESSFITKVEGMASTVTVAASIIVL